MSTLQKCSNNVQGNHCSENTGKGVIFNDWKFTSKKSRRCPKLFMSWKTRYSEAQFWSYYDGETHTSGYLIMGPVLVGRTDEFRNCARVNSGHPV